MPAWILPVFIFTVWSLSSIADVFHLTVEDARLGNPEGQRRVSLAPVIPVLPLSRWGIAWLIDVVARSWDTIVVGTAHVVLAFCLSVSIVRDWRQLRR